MGGNEKEGAILFSAVHTDGTRGNGMNKENHEIPTEHKKRLFHYEGDQPPAQAAQGGCAVSILGNIQKLFGHGSRQPALGASA